MFMGEKKIFIFFIFKSSRIYKKKKNTTFSAKNTKENKIKIKSEIKYLSKEVVELW